jgi:hypothetical protein
MLIGLEILGVSWAHVHALEVPYKNAFQVYPRADAVYRDMLKPGSGAFREVER